MRCLQAARWPVVARIVAACAALEWVKLPFPLGSALPCLLLLCTLGLYESGGVTDGEAAEFVGLRARQGSSRERVAGGTLWIDGAHSELIAACLLGSKFTGQQREPFLLVSPRCFSSVGACCFDGAGGV